MFGNGPIKRTEAIVKKEAKKTEIGIHSDEEFEKSLLEIDELDQIESNRLHKNDDVKQNSSKNNSKNDQNSLKYDSMISSENIKTNGDIKSEKSSAKYLNKNISSSSKEISKKVEEVKNVIKETNKRKFTEFIDGDDTDDSVKKKKHETDTYAYKTNGDNGKTGNHDDTFNDSGVDDKYAKNKNRRVNKSLNESGKES